MELLASLLVFLAAYTVNMTYITVFYHRALAHGAVRLRPGVRRLVAVTGGWLTGLDPAGWVCMHRIHHAHADTGADPHSPRNVGVFGVALAQLRSYERVLVRLSRGDPEYCDVIADLGFGVGGLNRSGRWMAPYATHAGIAIALSLAFGSWTVGPAYFVGLMSHPVQGWLVNSLGHAAGGRNFDTPDDSRNNIPVALLAFGEGLQNNHHAYPASPRFAARWWEPDAGWLLCRMLAGLRLLEIRRDSAIPTPLRPGPTPASRTGRN